MSASARLVRSLINERDDANMGQATHEDLGAGGDVLLVWQQDARFLRVQENIADLGEQLGRIAKGAASLERLEFDLTRRHLQALGNKLLEILGRQECGQVDVTRIILAPFGLASTPKGAHEVTLRQDALPGFQNSGAYLYSAQAWGFVFWLSAILIAGGLLQMR